MFTHHFGFLPRPISRARILKLVTTLCLLFVFGVLGLTSLPAVEVPEGVPKGNGWCSAHGEWSGGSCATCRRPSGPGGGGERREGPTQAQLDAQAARERREKASAFNELGIAAWNKGEWGIAGEQFQQAHAWNPDSKQIRTNLMNCRHQQALDAWAKGEWEYAKNCFQSALYHNPDSLEFKKNYEMALLKTEEERRKWEAQRKDHQELQKALAQHDLGRAAADAGDFATAVKHFDAAFNLYPAETVHRRNLAWAKGRLGDQAFKGQDIVTALAHWKSALLVDPADAYALKQVRLVEMDLAMQAQDKSAHTQITQDIENVSDKLATAPAPNDLGYGDLDPGGGAFGENIVKPNLQPAEKVSPGTKDKAGDQLIAGGALAKKYGDVKKLYEGGAEYAGSLDFTAVYASGSGVDASKLPEHVKSDPRMIASLKELTSLQLKRHRLESEREELTKERNLSKDPFLMQQASEKLDLKEKEFQKHLTVVAEKIEVAKKLHRRIDTEIESAPKVPPGKPSKPSNDE